MCINKKLSKLIELQANKIQHTNNSLLEHLKGTYKLLLSWDASMDLCNAGLFHAVYGTDGFSTALQTNKFRDSIRKTIGSESENIVYLYCSCDRDSYWPKIGRDNDNIMLNRFTDNPLFLTNNDIRNFCELTVANEIEISKNSNQFIIRYGDSLSSLFLRMEPYITKKARIAASDFILKYQQLSN